MRVHLSALTFDPLGAIWIDCLPDATLGETRRRMNRIATLDGGAVFNDSGYAEADRTIELRWKPTDAAREAQIERLVQIYSRLRVSTHKGVYIVAPQDYRPEAGQSRMTLLVAEKLTD